MLIVLPETTRARGRTVAGELRPNRRGELVAKSGADGNTLAAGRTTAAQHCCAALGLHTRTEAVLFYAGASVGLKCALGHGMRSCFLQKISALRQVSSLSQVGSGIQSAGFSPGPSYLAERVENDSRAGQKSERILSRNADKPRFEIRVARINHTSIVALCETILIAFTIDGATEKRICERL
jgi:hypothetical protein